jgi:hypothetical protein
METEETKVPMYKKKAFMIPVIAVMIAGFVFAGTLIFHHSDVTISVGEARYSADGTFAFNCLEGEIFVQNANIYNYANVDLYADVAYSEVSNVPTDPSDPAVAYTVTLPAQPTLLTSKTWTTVPVEVHCSEVSSAGAVTGSLDYTKVISP